MTDDADEDWELTGPVAPDEGEVEQAQEETRSHLATWFTVIFALTIAGAFAASFTSSWAQTKEWLNVALPAETGILGSALGFYFAARKGRR